MRFFSNSIFPNKILLLILFFILSSFCFAPFLDARESGLITRLEFTELMARSQPGHPLLPKYLDEVSGKELFLETVANLKKKGIHVWDQKDPYGKLPHQEFVRVAYAFSGGPPRKSLFEQKLFLKRIGIVSSTDIGMTTGLEGQATQFHDNKIAGNPLELASPIFMHDRIKTEPNSRTSITFDDMSMLTMAEDAEITISKHNFNPDKGIRQTIVNISLGTVRFMVSKARGKGSMFKVVTPTATAGVRGTEFVVTVEPDGRTRFIGIQDEIRTSSLLPDGGEIKWQTVGPGQTQIFSPDGKASAVAPAPAPLMKQFKQKTKMPRQVPNDKGITRTQARSAAARVRDAANGIEKKSTDATGNESGPKGNGKNEGPGETEEPGKKDPKGVENIVRNGFQPHRARG